MIENSPHDHTCERGRTRLEGARSYMDCSYGLAHALGARDSALEPWVAHHSITSMIESSASICWWQQDWIERIRKKKGKGGERRGEGEGQRLEL